VTAETRIALRIMDRGGFIVFCPPGFFTPKDRADARLGFLEIACEIMEERFVHREFDEHGRLVELWDYSGVASPN
jgi:hypothetical protein